MRRGKETTEAGRRKGKGNRANLTVTLAAALFCLTVLYGAGYYGITVVNQTKSQESRTNGLVAEGDVRSGTLHDPAGRQAELDEIVRGGLITFSTNAIPSMKDNGEINLMIENPPDNGTRFIVTILRDDMEEEIYHSGYLDPEQYIDSTVLDVALSSDEYPCTAYFDSYRIQDGSYLRRVAAKVIVFVLD